MKLRFVFAGVAVTTMLLSLLSFGRIHGAEEAMEKQAAYAAKLNTFEVASK